MQEQKKSLGRAIAAWVLFGILAAATIVIFVFYKDIFGVSHIHPVTKQIVWDYEPFFNQKVSDNPVAQTLFTQGVPGFLKCVAIIGCAITLGIGLHYLTKVRRIGSQKFTTVFI